MSTFTMKDLDEVVKFLDDYVKSENKIWSDLFKKFGADFDRDVMIIPLKFKRELNAPERLIGKKIFFSDYVGQCYFHNPEWKKPVEIKWQSHDFVIKNPNAILTTSV